MQEKIALSANDIERLKREAKQTRKSSGIPLSQAQDAIAQRLEYKNWSLLRRDQSKVKEPTADGLHRACLALIRSLSDSAIQGLCKGGLSIWAPFWQIAPSAYLISNEPHVAHLVSDLSDSLSPIPTRRSGHGVQPHPVPARHIAA
jgi:hypothetical protein